MEKVSAAALIAFLENNKGEFLNFCGKNCAEEIMKALRELAGTEPVEE